MEGNERMILKRLDNLFGKYPEGCICRTTNKENSNPNRDVPR
jgi:hypothetical protein